MRKFHFCLLTHLLLFTMPPSFANKGILLEANQEYSYFGQSVSNAGDVNGDGFDDVIVGAPEYDNGQSTEGAAFIFYGNATGINNSSYSHLEINIADAFFGNSVSTAGDINGDGFDDVIVGASWLNADKGGAFIFLGSENGIKSEFHAELNPPDAGSNFVVFGGSVSDAGDINGDGYDDVIVGAHGFHQNETLGGAAFIYLGSDTGINPENYAMLTDDHIASRFGTSVSSAGDVNGDGYDDIVVGAKGLTNEQSEEGAAFIFHGSVNGISSSPVLMLEGDQIDGDFGQSVSSAGDVNYDGYDDVIIGASYNDVNTQNSTGSAFIYLGSVNGLTSTAATHLQSTQLSDGFGGRVSGTGDVNDDGFDDVIVSAAYYMENGISVGAAFIYHGSASGVSTSASTQLGDGQDQENGSFGRSVSGAGDVNGDGVKDIIVTARNYTNGQTDEGVAFVFVSPGLDSDGDGIGDNQDNNPFSPNEAPQLTGTPATDVNEGEQYSFMPEMTDDGDTNTITYSINNSPLWATFDNKTGQLLGTPSSNDVGTTSGIIISVFDGYLESSLPSFNIEVIASSTTPVNTNETSSGGGGGSLGYLIISFICLFSIFRKMKLCLK